MSADWSRRKKKRRKINIEKKRHDDTPEIMLFLISVYCRFDLVRITIDSRKLISSLFLFKYALSLYDIFFNMFSFCFDCLLIFLLLLFLRKACETTHHRCYSLDVRTYWFGLLLLSLSVMLFSIELCSHAFFVLFNSN